jgi:DNA-binding FadR family transcriptional regulator
MMEPLCAGQAARNPDRESVKAAMKQFLEAGRPPLEGPEYYAATYDFHETVYDLAGNRVLSLLTKGVTHIVTSHVTASMDPVQMRASMLDEHEKLAAAISAGQPVKAERLMREHFTNLYDFYRRHWPARLEELVEWR